jgi:hypothetical protein
MLIQRSCDIQVVIPLCARTSGAPKDVGEIGIRPCGKQRFNYRLISDHGREHQGRYPEFILNVHFRAVAKEKKSYLFIADFGSPVESGRATAVASVDASSGCQ